jgi:hypothetical protein
MGYIIAKYSNLLIIAKSEGFSGNAKKAGRHTDQDQQLTSFTWYRERQSLFEPH